MHADDPGTDRDEERAAGRRPRRRQRVVVIGGGFAGIAATRTLAGGNVEVIVVDRHNFHTFQPLLYQVATAGLEPADVAYPIRTIFGRQENVTFRHGAVSRIRPDEQLVDLADGVSLPYDHLVVACGAVATYFGVAGAERHSHPLYTLSDARRLRNRLLSVLEDVDAHPERYDGGAPQFVVVGAGPTGVETAGALIELLEVCARRDRLRLDPARSQVILLDLSETVLAGFAGAAQRYAFRTLESRGVVVRLGAAVASIDDGGVRLSSGAAIPAAVVVWAGGVTVAGTVADTLGAARGRGARISVREDLSLDGHAEVFVAGDAAEVPGGHGSVAPQLAQVAMQSGRHAGRQILRRIDGLPTERFDYHDKGIMATVGRRAAVAQLARGPVITGTLGWLAWLALHLIYLIGFRNRLTVLINWCWRYLDWPSGPRLIVADAETTDDGPSGRYGPRPSHPTTGTAGGSRATGAIAGDDA